MATEACELQGRGGARSVGTAETTRYAAGPRALRSAGVALGGLVMGAMMLPIPGLHLMSPIFPLGTFAVAIYLWGVRLRVEAVEGPCPGCGAPVRASGLGPIGREDLWIRCDGCGAGIVVAIDRG
jgi:hypothetical protein